MKKATHGASVGRILSDFLAKIGGVCYNKTKEMVRRWFSMKPRPNYTVIVILILLLAVLAAMVMPVLSLIDDLRQIGSSVAVPSVPGVTVPSVQKPTELPTDPTKPEEPVTEPSDPATQPSEPESVPTVPADCAHSYEAADVAATCKEPGYTLHTCTLCGHSYADNYTDPGDHSYGDWAVNKEATCTAEGQEISTCVHCGHSQTRAVEAKGHSYGAWNTTKAATCTAGGEKERACSACGKVEQKALEPTGHAYDGGTVVKQATSCADTGIKAFTCKNCGHQYEATVSGDHELKCDTCEDYGTGSHTSLHDPACEYSYEHQVGCRYCDFGYLDMAYYYLTQGIIDESSALFTDTVKLQIPEYNGVLATWPERWHEFATFTQMGIMYGSWSAKDGWEGSDYEYRVWDITSQADAQAVLDDYNRFVVEFEKVYRWKPVEVKMEYREEKQYVRLYYFDQDQYKTYRNQKKSLSSAQMDALADEIIGYTLQKWGIRDGMTIASMLEYLYYMIWTDVAFYDHSLRFHSAFDGFATHTCVCDGYSEMFLLYAEALGIRAKEVTGRMDGVGHAWNKVIFSDGSEWYVDITNGPILETAEYMREAGYTWKE